MMSKLNIWVRNEYCGIVNRDAHLHIYDCQRKNITPKEGVWFQNGHIEYLVPPGCYIISAGIPVADRRNVYTDFTMVIVKCGEDICINLVLNYVDESELSSIVSKEMIANLPLIGRGCGARIIIPFIVNAAKGGIEREDIKKVVNVIAKAANIDENQIQDGIKFEIDGIKKNIKDPDEETREYMKLLEDYLL